MNKGFKECRRVIEHIPGDRSPTGDDIGNDLDYEQHLEECNDCRATHKLLELMHKRDDDHGTLPALDDLAARRLVNSILDSQSQRADVTMEVGHNEKTRLLVAGALAVIAAAVLLAIIPWLRSPEDKDTNLNLAKTDSPSNGVPITGSSFALLSGKVQMGSKAADADGAIESRIPVKTGSGRAVISLPTGIAVSMSRDTTLSIDEEAGGMLKVRLAGGRALFSLDPARDHRGFQVVTETGSIKVLGTVFTVEVSKGRTWVHLHRGRVEIRHMKGTVRTLSRVESTTMADSGMVPVPATVDKEMRTLVEEILALGLGDHLRPLVRTPGSETIPPTTGIEPAEASEVLPDTILSGANAALPSLGTLMKRARSAKLDGDWETAAAFYEDVMRRFPKSNDAKTSRVSLGQLNLDRLARPQKALVHFSYYLKMNPSGPLAQEALFGRAKCHRALGNTEAERRALEFLLSNYSGGLYEGMAKKRIGQLSPVR